MTWLSLCRTYRGRAYAEVGQYESALTDLSAAIHLDPKNAEAFYYRGALLRTAAPKKALQDLSISMMLDDSEKNVLVSSDACCVRLWKHFPD